MDSIFVKFGSFSYKFQLRARMQTAEEANEVAEAGNEDLFKLGAMKTQDQIDIVDKGLSERR